MFPGAPSRPGPRPHHLQMPSTSSKPPQTPLPTNLQLNATYPSPHPTRPGFVKRIEPNVLSHQINRPMKIHWLPTPSLVIWDCGTRTNILKKSPFNWDQFVVFKLFLRLLLSIICEFIVSFNSWIGLQTCKPFHHHTHIHTHTQTHTHTQKHTP